MKSVNTRTIIIILAALASTTALDSVLFAQCGIPSDLLTLGVQTNSADISWSAVSGSRYYRVKYKKSTDSSWRSKRTQNTSLSLTNLASGTPYDWKVKTVCRGSSSVYSAIENFTTLGSCPIPTPFDPLGVGSHQATLVWLNINNQVDSYNVRWRELGTSSWNVVSSVPTNLYIVYGLQPLITYEYQVQSNCGSNTSPYSSSKQWMTPENVCTAPLNLQVTNIGTNFADFSWGFVGGTEHYRLRYREVGSAIWLFKDFISLTNTTVNNLFPNATYEAQVQSECTLGATDWSAIVTFTTLQISTCDAPQNLFASMVTASSAKHNWDAVIGALSYTMRRRISGTQVWTHQFNTTETFITTYLLDPATTYEYQVQTHCTIGDSPFSASAYYTTQGDPPCPAAENLVVNNITPTSADFDWSDVAAVLHYRFEWRPQSTSNWSWLTTTSSHISRTGLTANTTYEWRIGTLCTSGGTYTFSNIATFQTTPAGQCTVPNGLFVLGVAQTQATLIWSSIPEALDYDTRIKATTSANWTTYSGVTSNLLVVYNLSPGTEYEFQVQANCAGGSSGFSGSDIFTTQAAADMQSEIFLINSPVNFAEQNQDGFDLFPNPVGQELTINLKNEIVQPSQIGIYDLNGQKVMDQNWPVGSDQAQINLARKGLGTGVFIIQLTDKSGIVIHQEKIILR